VPLGVPLGVRLGVDGEGVNERKTGVSGRFQLKAEQGDQIRLIFAMFAHFLHYLLMLSK
jgi:hypothetical protein